MASPFAGASSTTTSYPILECVLETYTRTIKVGDSEAMFGPRFIVVISRPFTAGEDAIMTWVRMQDDSRLVDIVPLKDGRDFLVFERNYVKQTFAEAFEEARRYTEAILRMLPKQHDSSDTPKAHAGV